jgi:hypothetical protein
MEQNNINRAGVYWPMCVIRFVWETTRLWWHATGYFRDFQNISIQLGFNIFIYIYIYIYVMI